MKRFIDLGSQITTLEGDRQFAWYDTVVDRFESHYGTQCWETWAEFERDYEGNEIERYRSLCPAWVPK